MRFFMSLGIAVCTICVGCDPVAQEKLTLELPNTSEAESATAALRLISEVMTNDGFTQVSMSIYSNTAIVASFAGSGRLGCFVYHRAGHIEVVMQEMGKFKSRPEAIKARDDLKRKLSDKFGQEKVSE